MQHTPSSTAPAGDFPAAATAAEADTEAAIAEHIRAIITLLGDDPTREGLEKTPRRAARALRFLTSGSRMTAEEVVNGAIFAAPGAAECDDEDVTEGAKLSPSGMVIVRDVEFHSMCEHHILPFFGRISIGYIPRRHVLGLSKLARLVDLHARRLQLQERLASSVAADIAQAADTPDVIVAASASHLCMRMRGVTKELSTTLTVTPLGRFASSPELRAEFLAALNALT